MVAVYALEELPELSFGLVNEFAELFVGSADRLLELGWLDAANHRIRSGHCC